jgi:hypothetical protein
MNDEKRPGDSTRDSTTVDTEPLGLLQPVPGYDEHALDLDVTSDPTAQADRRNTRSKLAAGWRGIELLRPLLSRYPDCHHGSASGY